MKVKTPVRIFYIENDDDCQDENQLQEDGAEQDEPMLPGNEDDLFFVA